MFGERFQSYISKTVRAFQDLAWSTLTRKNPFNGPLHNKDRVEGDHFHTQNLLDKVQVQPRLKEVPELATIPIEVNIPLCTTPNISNIPDFLCIKDLKHVHPLIKQLFTKIIPQIPLAGRLKKFQNNWEKLTQDPKILKVVSGYDIQFSVLPKQNKPPHATRLSTQQRKMMKTEVGEMLMKGAIKQVTNTRGQFLSNIFLVIKKYGGNRPVINLKNLNSFIPYQHFKMEGLHLLKEMLKEGDFMCKLDLKDAYFCSPSRKLEEICNLYEFLCLCFGLNEGAYITAKAN